jgi:hypothetical protein
MIRSKGKLFLLIVLLVSLTGCNLINQNKCGCVDSVDESVKQERRVE